MMMIIIIINITQNILVRIEWIKYIINFEVYFGGYLYITHVITTSISLKETHMHVNSACVNVFVMRLCVCNRIEVQLKGFNECQLFSSICRLMGICEESDCSLVNCHIVCFMWRCACASAARSRHKQYERSEMKVRMFINIIQYWPSGM